MSLFWYYRPEHTQGGRNPSAHCEVSDWVSRGLVSFLVSSQTSNRAPVQPEQTGANLFAQIRTCPASMAEKLLDFLLESQQLKTLLLDWRQEI